MDGASNALFTALGAYDSDGGNGSDVPSRSESPQTPAGPDVQQEDAGRRSPARGARGSGPSSGADSADECESAGAVAYAEIRRDLCTLLGCDAVPDIAPVESEEGCPELQAKFQQWYELKEQGANFNEALMRNKTFRNPNIYRWLVDHLELEEAGSNLPADSGFEPSRLRRDFLPARLAEEQERRARESAARKAARAGAQSSDAAAIASRQHQFRSAGYEAPQLSSGGGIAASGPPISGSAAMLPGGGQSIEEAIQRAKQIAQRLARSKPV
ncbi:SAP30-binding protein [Coemansia spiralis]|nr:SAP30-binding protein [Coemansia spiralis]